jgi:predicted membrane protein
MNTSARRWFGLLLILAGAFFLLDTMNVIDVRTAFHQFWPLLLVLWGFWVIMRPRGDARHAPTSGTAGSQVFGDLDTGSAADILEHSNVFGDVRIKVTSQNFRGGTISTVFGDAVIDCSGAALADGEQVLAVSGVFGDCTFRLPKGTHYSLSANTLFGSIRAPFESREGISAALTFESKEYAAAGKRLRLRLSQVFGDVRVEE